MHMVGTFHTLSHTCNPGQHKRVIAVLRPLSLLDVSCKDRFQLSTTFVDTDADLHPVTMEDSY